LPRNIEIFMKLSIVIPVYNESKTIKEVLKKIGSVDLGDIEKEIVIVDDFSIDGTREILKELEGLEKFKIHFHEKNMGKGAAIRSGFKLGKGDIFLIQDADLEYDPQDYNTLLKPILDGKADVVFGSRFIGNQAHRVFYNTHYLANKFLTFFSNLLTGLNISDMETCYKVFNKEAVQKILPHLVSNRFGIEPELTAKVAKHKLRVFEVGISYSGRTYEEGKHINWKDGLAAIWHIVHFNLFSRK